MVSQFLIEFILIFGMKSTQRVTHMYSPCMLHTCQYMYLPYSLLTELKTEKKPSLSGLSTTFQLYYYYSQ